jgi:hypothetical protein
MQMKFLASMSDEQADDALAGILARLGETSTPASVACARPCRPPWSLPTASDDAPTVEDAPFTPLAGDLAGLRLALVSAGGVFRVDDDLMGPDGPSQQESLGLIKQFLRGTATLSQIPKRLQVSGVESDERGSLAVDAHQRTSNPRVFAAGEVSGVPQYVYVAAQTGHVPAANALGDSATVDHRGLPGVTFTSPQLASAGWTRSRRSRGATSATAASWGRRTSPRALVDNDTRGALKL